jgi:hypothetical protein
MSGTEDLSISGLYDSNTGAASTFPQPGPPYWEFPEGAVVGLAVSAYNGTAGEIELVFEQASQRIRAVVVEADVDPKLWQIANDLGDGDLAYVRGRFPHLDDDDQRNVILALEK